MTRRLLAVVLALNAKPDHHATLRANAKVDAASDKVRAITGEMTMPIKMMFTPDGSIVVVGTKVTSGQGYYVPTHLPDFVYQDSGLSVLRLNPDGSIDSSFRSGDVSGFRVDAFSADGTIGARGDRHLRGIEPC